MIWGPTQRPKLKLSDFGLAKSFRENAGFVGLTRQGDVGGSVGFISPDHIRDFRDLKEPADIYSAGATLYYLLTLHYPFLNFDPYKADAYSMILENPPVPLRAHRPDAPEGLERVLARALEKQPRDRWKSARAMAVALAPYLERAGIGQDADRRLNGDGAKADRHSCLRLQSGRAGIDYHLAWPFQTRVGIGRGSY